MITLAPVTLEGHGVLLEPLASAHAEGLASATINYHANSLLLTANSGTALFRIVLSASSAAICLGLAAACAGAPRSTTSLAWPFPIDTLRTETLRPGVTRGFLYVPSGPWAINVLRVELGGCYRAVAVKGGEAAGGRAKTSTLLGAVARTQDVVGGVNADFFSLTAPRGVPTGAMVSRGRVIAGPSDQPVLAFDSKGRPRITTLHTRGTATIRGRKYPINGWNRATPSGLALFDANWGEVLDTASSAIEVVFVDRAHVAFVDTATAGSNIPADGFVLVAGRDAPDSVRAELLSLRAGDVVRAEVAIAPMQPREAVGGRPLLVRDSLVQSVVDTEGQPGFATGRHPRTAAGIARGGRYLILVVVDGRQMPYSDGMTLRELANLMLAFGARDAINLDGGGSTTFVYSDSSRALRIGNQPSDSAGERAVGNALGLVRTCGS